MKIKSALLLMLFCLISLIPLVSANPSPSFPGINSQLVFPYTAIAILSVALTDFAIYLIRRKNINKHNYLQILTLSLIISLLVSSLILTSSEHITSASWILTLNALTVFAYSTMAVTLVTIAESLLYLIRVKKVFKEHNS